MCYGESLLPLSSLVTDFSRRTGKTDVEEAESDCRNVVHSGALCCLSCLAGFNYDLLVRLSHSGNALPLVDGRAKDNTGSRRGSRAALRTAVLVVGGGVVGSSAIVFLSRPPYCARISQGNAGNLRIASACESGGIGRRTRLRIWRGNPWGFESPLSHQSSPLVPLVLVAPGLRSLRPAHHAQLVHRSGHLAVVLRDSFLCLDKLLPARG